MEGPLPDRHSVEQTRLRSIAVIAALIGLAAIAYLAISIVRQVSVFNQDTFDRAQWSLNQTEIEFLEFSKVLTQGEPDLGALRLRFDIFYSRVTTVADAAIFAPLRDEGDFAVTLGAIQSFLEMAVPIIDAPDQVLLDNRETLISATDDARQNVRSLAITGLELYTFFLDQQRREVRLTTTQLVAVIAALFAGLVLTLLQMDRLNKRAAQRGQDLLQSNTRLNTIIGSALDGIIVTDADFRIIEFNPAAEDIFHCSAAKAIGRDLMSFVGVTPRDESETDRTTSLNMLLGTRGRVKGSGSRPDRSVFPIEIALERAATIGGNIQVAFIRDISRREAADRELVAARDAALAGEKVKSDFLATMSHEIRTPLNGLMGNVDLLRETELSDQQQRYVQNMVTSGRMLMQHVSDVLDITQYDAGKLRIKVSTTHLPTLIEDIVVTQMGVAETKKISLSWHWEGTPVPWVRTDPDRLQLIFMNLVSNAVKFTQTGQVAVSAQHVKEDGQDCLRLAVADTGPGISPNQLPHVFDDFVTGDVSEARVAGGSGLGLGIARRFTEALGGTIDVDSTLGEGSTFRVTVPIEIAAAPEKDTTAPTVRRVRQQHILLVEDNDINRSVAREMLETDGHRVTEAIDGATGVALADATAYDLILMDISMPGMDGREAAERIAGGNGASRMTPIIALTANVFAGKAQKFLSCGLIATVTKPIHRDTLRATLAATASQRSYPGAPVVAAHLTETRAALGDDGFVAIQDRFAKEVEDFVAFLTAIPRAPLSEVAEAAHNVASSASLFGAARLQGALLELERCALAGDALTVHIIRRDLPGLWADTQSVLQEDGAANIPAS